MMRTEDRRFRNLKVRLAVFIAVALGAIAVVVFLIGRENDLFTKKYSLHFTTVKGTGFTRGMPVKLSGFRIGRVAGLALNQSATVDIVMQIDEKYQQWIRKDSVAKLTKEGLVGDMIVDVSVGSQQSPMLKEGDAIAFVKTKALDEMADEIASKVTPVLMEVRDIIGYVNDPKGDLKQSIKHLNALTQGLEQSRLKADALISESRSDMKVLTGSINKSLETATMSLNRTDRSLAKIEERLPEMLDSTGTVLKNAKQLSADLKNTSDQVLPKLPALLEHTEGTMQNANEVMNAVKGMWPIRSSIAPKENLLLVPGDSNE